MKTQNKVVIALAAAIAAIGAYVGIIQDPDRGAQSSVVTSDLGFEPKGVDDGERSTGSLIAPVFSNIETKAFDGVATYADLQSRLAGIELDPAQKAEHLRIAAIFCEGRNIFERRSAYKTTKSDLVYRNYSQNFCKNFSGRSDDQLAAILTNPDSDVAMAQTLVADDDAIRSYQSRAVAESILRNSAEPSAVIAAAGILSMAPEGSWTLGSNLAKSAVEIQSLPEARWLAAQMVACDLSGGCGPGEFYSMTQCANFQACGPSASLTDIWRENTAKPVYRLATEIRQELLKGRR